MKKIVLWFMSTLTAVTLLFGYHTSTSSQAAATPDSSAVAPVASGTDGTSSPSGTTVTGTTVTVTGDEASTRWGPVQVRLTVSGGTITDVTVVEYPDGNGKDQQINSYALPVLVSETMDANSADIDMVSGATVTSDGYVSSLQSALDLAGIGG